MDRRPLFWNLFPSYVVVIGLSLAAVTWYATSSLRGFHHKEVETDLEARARLVEKQFARALDSGDSTLVDALCKDMGKRAATRVTVILPSGKVMGDSDEDPSKMENHATPSRPEVMAALAGRMEHSVRHSATLDKNMMYLAIPLMRGDEVAGVVRTALPVTAIDEVLDGVHRKLAVAGLLIGVLAAALSLLLSRRVSRPIAQMKAGAERFARGDLDVRLAVPDTEELAGLAQAMNEMAAQLGERLNRILQQRNEQEAILASMVEGVVAIANDERLISVNRAAVHLLAIDLADPVGRSIEEVVRNTAFQSFATRALKGPTPAEDEIALSGKAPAVLQVHGAALRDAQGRQIGAVIVLNDVTRLRRLENVRSDFVANVSHELKTPITSIKGFVETLLDGALRNPDDAQRFLAIIAKQADRLNTIIEDLLLLSRLEQGTGTPGISLEECRLKGVLDAAVQACCVQAGEKGITVSVTCGEELTARVNPPLLEQAVVNLVDNALKYSEAGQPIVVRAEQTPSETLITVSDHGCGIEKQHLPRLFERFYRVDKARSRTLGGTGLGLAIVKHIAQVHQGRVTVESTPGKGSRFTIRLPNG